MPRCDDEIKKERERERERVPPLAENAERWKKVDGTRLVARERLAEKGSPMASPAGT